MKILKQGIIDTSVCTCDCCQAELEYTSKDIVGSGKITPIEGDWVDIPVIQNIWPDYVKRAIKKYSDSYVASGYFAKRDGYIECPCCGHKIYFDIFPVQNSVYPCEAITDEGDVMRDEIISIPNTAVSLLKSHYNEFYKK